MNENRRNWRGWVAAGLLAAVLFLVVDRWPSAPVATPAQKAAPKERPEAPSPAPLDTLNRAAMMDAVALTASAHAAGKAMDGSMAQLRGRRFELILPFGCNGPSTEAGDLTKGWRYDADAGVLQVAYPSNIQALSGGDADDGSRAQPAVKFAKSFWIEREWLRDGVCPSGTQKISPAGTTPARMLAIAELSAEQAPRADDRDGVPYRVSKRLPPEQIPGDQGLRLIVSGRLIANDIPPIQCKTVSRDQRPICTIIAEIDRVAITDPDGALVYGEWQS
jgi:hypothetical protein